jgi:hypothetical protein
MKSKGLVLSIVLVCLVVAFSFLSEADAKILSKGSGSGSVPAFVRVGGCYILSVGEKTYSGKVVYMETTGWVGFAQAYYWDESFECLFNTDVDIWVNVEEANTIYEEYCEWECWNL